MQSFSGRSGRTKFRKTGRMVPRVKNVNFSFGAMAAGVKLIIISMPFINANYSYLIGCRT